MPKTTAVPKVKLTKRTLDALRAGTLTVDGVPVRIPEKGVLILRDTEMKGFGVRVTPAGTMSFVLERSYRTPDGKGKMKRWTLGRFGDITVDQARKWAEETAGDFSVRLHYGKTPDAERKTSRLRTRTLGDALSEYLRTRPLKERTRLDVEATLSRYLNDWLARPAVDITPTDVVRRYQELCQRTVSGANVCMRYLRAVFGFVQHSSGWKLPDGTPLIRENPVAEISRNKAWRSLQPRQTVIEPHQLAPWFEAVLADPDPRARIFYRFVLLTGCRRSEALHLTWDCVDTQGKKVTFTDTKARRDHVLPLGPYLSNILEQWRGEAGTPWVFSDRQGTRLENLRYSIERIRKRSGVTFRVHDLRRTFASVGESLELSAYALKRLLNHSTSQTRDVTSAYVVLSTERLRSAMTKIEERILTLANLHGPEKSILA